MSASTSFQNEMLVANAGSGKTFELTTRIIRLLLAGVRIDRIAALTFTRKSAGEFLDELLQRIAFAATNPDKLAELKTASGCRELDAADCIRLLEHIVEYFGRIGLSTIDSFFARIARQFPLESGLPEEFAIADSASLSQARERAMAACFASATRDNAGLQAMIDQCRQISRKGGERDVFGTLLRQIDSLHQRYLETPESCVWGDPDTIWDAENIPFSNAPELGQAIDHLERIVRENSQLSEEALESFSNGLALIRGLQPGQAWSSEIKNFIDRRLCNDPKTNFVRITPKKTGWLELTPDIRKARRDLVEALFRDLLDSFIERSQGLYQFVSDYEEAYSRLVRNAGLISFLDITTLLAERAAEANSIDAIDWQAQVAYRIDQRFDHWLLDEFQDTSRTQWAILKAFIEEVIMDESGERSFFYVGDTKQAIYGWRGGDSELFREIFERYSPGVKEAEPLTDSWRSTESVISMVNTIFGNLGEIREELEIPEQTIAKWQAGWNTHQVAEPIRSRTGYASWRSIEKNEKDETPAQHQEVLRIIQEVDPVGKAKECAVLLRQNKQVAQLAAYLQAEGIPVAVEGKTNPCTDNPLGSAILAALRAVAHPADSISAAIAQGMPCASAWQMSDMEAFREETLRAIADQGFAPTIQKWVELALSGPSETFQPPSEEPFLQSRADALLAAAERFDSRVSSDAGIDAFIASIESLEVQEAEARDVIRLMTVHQSKGLGFDMVIVCGLDDATHGQSSNELVLGPDKKDPKWGMLLPRKEVAESEPVLREQSDRLASESKTNELCGAYVALTRAKRALYVITNELSSKTSAKHFGRLLQLTLSESWEEGCPDWHTQA